MTAAADFQRQGFQGRSVLVTGGTRGIGRVIAETFLAAGAEVAVGGRTPPDTPPSAGGRTARFLAADVREPGQAAGLVEAAAEPSGRLDVLVNNAGGAPSAEAAEVSPRFVAKVVGLNLLAPFHTAQPANRIMRRQPEGGWIVNIGSVAAYDPQPGTAAYTAAKAGLLGLTRALALEWAPKVRVNHVTAGPVRTEAADEVFGPAGADAVDRVVPMRRMAGPADIARACLLLASDPYITGADLAVHGGGEVPARYLVLPDRPGPGEQGRGRGAPEAHPRNGPRKRK